MTTDQTPQQRAALVTRKLTLGARLTTAEIATECQMTYQGARQMMLRLSGPGLPFVQNGEGRWYDINISIY